MEQDNCHKTSMILHEITKPLACLILLNFTIEAVNQLLGGESVTEYSIQTALYQQVNQPDEKGVYLTLCRFENHSVDAGFAPLTCAIFTH